MDKCKYIAKRLVMAAITMLLITMVVFIVIQLPPGDFVDTLVAQMVSEGERVTQVEIDNLRAAYGVDRPMVIQYLDWLGGILTGDWGTSFYFNQSVLVKIGETLGITLVLSLSTLLFTYVLSIPIAIYSAKH
ncbi:MAG: ABC transporter permease, partial [Butyricicoccus sp.]